MNEFGFSLVATALAASLVAGCGSGGGEGGDRLSKAEYEQKMQAIDAKRRSLLSEFGLLVGLIAQDPARADLSELAAKTAEAQEAARDTAEDFERLTPPEEVEDLHEKLIEGTREFAEDLDELREAAENDDRAAAARFARNFQNLPSVQKLADAARDFLAKGYKLTK